MHVVERQIYLYEICLSYITHYRQVPVTVGAIVRIRSVSCEGTLMMAETVTETINTIHDKLTLPVCIFWSAT